MRKNSVNPVHRKGLRILDCPFYKDCLMHAAKLNWKAWSCAECINRKLHSIQQKIKLIAPYYKVILMLFNFGEGGHLTYISNARREDMIMAIKEWLVKEGETIN